MAVIGVHDQVYNRREDTTSSSAVTKPLPTSVKALAGIIVVFGLIILGIIAWKVGKWRRSKIRAASQIVAPDYKPKSAIHVDLAQVKEAPEKQTETYEPYKWQPIARPEPVLSSHKTTKSGTKRFLGFLANTVHPKPSLAVVEPSPPPAYTPPLPTIATPTTLVIGVGPGSHASNAISQITLEMLQTDPNPTHTPAPLPSPVRTKSIGPDTPVFKKFSSVSAPPSKPQPKPQGDSIKPLPRIMIVACTFVPSLADELMIKIGEPLMMVEEYEDEWCLVQRIGTTEAERGVVPRFCLQECPDKAIPILKQLMGSH